MSSIQQSTLTPVYLANTETGEKTIHHQIVVVGGGVGGITVISQLFKKTSTWDIALIEPSQNHYYQPGWTLVGGGEFRLEETLRQEKNLIPQGTTWIQDYVVKLDPDCNTVITKKGITIQYDYLVLSPGIQIDWHRIKGLKETLGKNGVTSNYSPRFAPYTWELLQNFSGGNAIFTFPDTPIKCGGAPQKIMYMADDIFKSKSGVGTQTKVTFCTADTKLFSVPEYAAVLEKVIERRNIKVNFQYNLKEIQADTKQAIFEVITDRQVKEISLQYDMIHVAPPMSAPDFIKNSSLAVSNSSGGWIDVDSDTLQHNRYPNVFALGDASALPTSKTAAAVRKQAPVLVENLISASLSKPLSSKYDGYTCCPLITGYNYTVMAEFDYNKKPLSSFLINPVKERWSMWLVKKHLLPWIYWNRMLKGEPFEGNYLKF